MLINGRIIAIPEEQQCKAREQLELPSDFFLVEATRVLHHDTSNGLVQIPLPVGLFVVAFENLCGRRRYGVVRMAAQE